MIFTSDNAVGAAPEILTALAQENSGFLPSYGEEPLAKHVQAQFRELFECEVAVFPVLTGTAANALAIAALCPPWGVTFCHKTAHIQVDECGAPVFFSGGADLSLLSGAAGKISPDLLTERITQTGRLGVHQTQPSLISVTNATESGAVYTAQELVQIGAVAKQFNLKFHMDGARFANAVAASGETPAALTWQAGVDALSFGGTKNGCLAVEALIFFNPSAELCQKVTFLRKRSGHLLSKGRFFSAQLSAYLAQDRWLNWAHHANAMRARLAQGLIELSEVPFSRESAANILFIRLPMAAHQALQAAGAQYYMHPEWDHRDGTERYVGARLVMSYQTDIESVDSFLRILRESLVVPV